MQRKTDLPQPSVAIGVGDNVTLPAVSQSMPQSGISPVLTKYKQYLQCVYNARVLAPADKYLPTLDAPYINLAMIRRGYCNPEQRDEFTKQTLHGGVDEILQSKTPINIEDLLTPEDNGNPVRFILVEGPPGIGKSTFAWEACRRWDEIESLQNYHAVVLLKLREEGVLNAVSLPSLFRYEDSPELSKSISEELAITQGRNLLLLLDGFDEVSHSFHEKSVIKSILCRQLLPECTIILTTRPSAKHTLKSICQPRVDKHVEIIGFAEEERVSYITEVFSKEPELQANFLKYMFLVPHIKSMMYIPLNCAIIARVYYESQSSRHLAIPRTRTQLYKTLTHSLLVRHMKMKESNFECTSMLPERLNIEDKDMFMTLAKFAFDSYHSISRKVTFFKEDIPEGLVHFGFMNESTEMYAGKGVERTFSFLHLSLQEYLAAWHLASSYSIEFQVAYHGLAVKTRFFFCGVGNNSKEEEALLSSLMPLGGTLMERAIFLAGITGWRCQSEDDRNPWEMYVSRDTADFNDNMLSLSLYEAQNPNILPHFYSSEGRRNVTIGSGVTTPYSCYAHSYCLANSSDQFTLTLKVLNDDDTSLVETFVKGLNDHYTCTVPKIRRLELELLNDSITKKCLGWIMNSRFLTELEEMIINSKIISWEWLAGLQPLSKLKVLEFSCWGKCSLPPTDPLCWLIEHRLAEIMIDVNFPSSTIYEMYSPTDVLVDSVLKSAVRGNIITKMVMPNISRETMAGVRSMLLHCPSLTTLELMRTRLGYDGILYICSALRNNTTLKHLVIYDDLQLPYTSSNINITSFKSMETVPLPGKTTCTDFLLELNGSQGQHYSGRDKDPVWVIPPSLCW